MPRYISVFVVECYVCIYGTEELGTYVTPILEKKRCHIKSNLSTFVKLFARFKLSVNGEICYHFRYSTTSGKYSLSKLGSYVMHQDWPFQNILLLKAACSKFKFHLQNKINIFWDIWHKFSTQVSNCIVEFLITFLSALFSVNRCTEWQNNWRFNKVCHIVNNYSKIEQTSS